MVFAILGTWLLVALLMSAAVAAIGRGGIDDDGEFPHPLPPDPMLTSAQH